MIKLEMENCNMILTEKQQKHHHYHLEKLINMKNVNILQVKIKYTVYIVKNSFWLNQMLIKVNSSNNTMKF